MITCRGCCSLPVTFRTVSITVGTVLATAPVGFGSRPTGPGIGARLIAPRCHRPDADSLLGKRWTLTSHDDTTKPSRAWEIGIGIGSGLDWDGDWDWDEGATGPTACRPGGYGARCWKGQRKSGDAQGAGTTTNHERACGDAIHTGRGLECWRCWSSLHPPAAATSSVAPRRLCLVRTDWPPYRYRYRYRCKGKCRD